MGNLLGSNNVFESSLFDHDIFDQKISNYSIGKDKTNVKILTYNIMMLPPTFHNFGNDYKNERLHDFIKLIDEYDIICLQEMFGSFTFRKEVLIESAIQKGFLFVVTSETPFLSTKLVDSGLIILSRYPIIESSFVPYGYGVNDDGLADTGVIFAKIQIRNSYLFLFNTQLQASYLTSEPREFRLEVETRFIQIKELNYCIRQILNTLNYLSNIDEIILLGDFNVDAFNYKHKIPKGLKQELNINKDNKYNKAITEYEDFIKLLNSNKLSVTNMFYKHNKVHPITYEGDLQSLDYVFEVEYLNTDNIDELIIYEKKLILSNIELKTFQIDNINNTINTNNTYICKEYGIQAQNSSCEHLTDISKLIYSRPKSKYLSDHFGIFVEFNINK